MRLKLKDCLLDRLACGFKNWRVRRGRDMLLSLKLLPVINLLSSDNESHLCLCLPAFIFKVKSLKTDFPLLFHDRSRKEILTQAKGHCCLFCCCGTLILWSMFSVFVLLHEKLGRSDLSRYQT